MRNWLVVAVLFVTACGDGASPTSPSGEIASFSWTVDGAAFQATSNGRAAANVSGTLNIAGADCSRGPTLNILLRQAASTGTFSTGSGGVLEATWTPDARTGSAAGTAFDALGGTRGSGSLTLSEVSGTWVKGSFSLQMVARPGQADQANKTVQGSFSLPLREVRVC